MGPNNRGYKRSWKNILLDKGYQLPFTLLMVFVSAVLMGLLGWWVLVVADQATTVARNQLFGVPCPQVLEARAPDPAAGAAATDAAVAPSAAVETGADETGSDETGADETGADDMTAPELPLDEALAGESKDDASAAEVADDERAQPVVTIDDSHMPEPPIVTGPTAEEIAASVARRKACEERQQERRADLDSREALIGYVLVAASLLLTVGLFLYGLKMTHRVAGPLFKVQLYMAKLRDGKYDTVYDLRKGDQLVEFYQHFKHAHAGLRRLQEEDRNRLAAILAAADKAELAARSPELAAAIEELRTLLAEKEESLG